VTAHEARKACAAAWVIISLVLVPVAAAPLVAPEKAVAPLLPQCWSMKTTGQPCFFCGMTRGFFAIGRADFSGAMAANAGAVPLFTAILCNEVLILSLTVHRLCKKRRGD
jgi:hypothetical protein